jgi:hypothetical protein
MRDSDIELAKFIWEDESIKQNFGSLINLPLYNFFNMLNKKKFTSLESIGRARRKCQEDYPELRGNTYKRKKEIAKEFKKQLTNENSIH